jgi:hypothetical protein
MCLKETTMTEPLRTLETATVLLVIAALGGLLMAGIRLGGKTNPPVWLAMAHGFLAAAPVVLLIYAACTVGLPSLALYGTVLFVVAALGGVTMNLGYHWKNLPLPQGLMIGHATLAIIGFVLVVMATLAARG